MKQYKFTILLTGFTLMLVGLLLLSYQPQMSSKSDILASEQQSNQVQNRDKSIIMKDNLVQLSEGPESIHLTEEELFEKTEAFIQIMVQDLDQNYMVKGISSKKALIEQYSDVVTEEALKPYIDYYFEEHEGGLYVLPTELPPWFMPDRPYEKTQLDNGNIVIEQENELEMYGRYRIKIELSYQDGWKIVGIEHPPANGENLELI